MIRVVICCSAPAVSGSTQDNFMQPNRRNCLEPEVAADHFVAAGHEQQEVISEVAAEPKLRKFALQRRIGKQGDLDDAVVEPHPILERILHSQ